ncbi:F-box protein At3g07870-like [Corylus avellana]|uniref:F-box protein At3g07870-like n=1 Tax=Corylus avellana TaxID=13451 RepID=UPI00286CBD9C|nr:F-box protein At3g07870-like [Corylus avellana]XP_059431482.1 F-box protein At3g07870-like [Corylus avellana]
MEHYLPTETLFDIFARLPVKSLLRFRCVSPLWCNIIDDPSLAYMHRLRCAEEPKVLLLDPPTDQPVPEVMFGEDGMFLKASLNLLTRFADSKEYFLQGWCNGLLCFTKKFCADSPLFLLNPLRQEVVQVQPPSPWIDKPQYSWLRRVYGLGFDSSTNTYKIVGLLCGISAQVYTLGGSWRAITEGQGPPCAVFGWPIYACGALHWLVKLGAGTEGDLGRGKIVYFDVGKEEFGLISRPEFRPSHLVDLRGDLAIVDRSSDKDIKVWVMKEYEKKEWVKEYKIGLAGVPRKAQVRVMGLCEHGEILLKLKQKKKQDKSRNNYLFYNPKTDMLKYSHIPSLNGDTQVLCHMSTPLSVAKFRAAE